MAWTQSLSIVVENERDEREEKGKGIADEALHLHGNTVRRRKRRVGVRVLRNERRERKVAGRQADRLVSVHYAS